MYRNQLRDLKIPQLALMVLKSNKRRPERLFGQKKKISTNLVCNDKNQSNASKNQICAKKYQKLH